MHPVQAKILSTPAAKLRAALRLYWSARRLKAAALRQQHPGWMPEQIEQATRDAFRHARD
jgi:Rv0078B-related antitoxin